MRTLVLGAGGQVGRELLHALAGQGEVVAATRTGAPVDGARGARADLADPASVIALLEAERPERVVNAAAYTAVDRAEGEPALAQVVNAEAPGEIARWCAGQGVPLVHYSTDYVFDGQGSRPYRVDDPTAPLGVYGRTKLAGERAVRAAGGRHLIFRTAWVYAAHGHNFLRTMLRLGAERDALRVVSDQVGTPTPAGLIADVTARALAVEGAASGTWHLTAAGDTSWHGFAEAIFEGAAARGLLSRVPRVEAIPTSEYPTPARRPAYSCLDTSTLERDFGLQLPHWRDGVAGVLNELARAGDRAA